MLLTCADQLAQTGKLENMLEEIRFGAGHEFNKIMPIATTDAIAARRADGSVDKPLMQKSGGLTLISSILRQVDQGLQATVDQADLIFHKYKDAESHADYVRIVQLSSTPRAISKPIPTKPPAEEAEAASAPVVQVVSSKPVVPQDEPEVRATRSEILNADAFVLRGKSAMIPAEAAPKAPTEPARVGKPVAPVAPTNPDAPKKVRPGFMPKAKTSKIIFHAKSETRVAYEAAVTYLAEQGTVLSTKIDDLSSDAIVEAAVDNVTWLTDHLDAVDVADDPVLEKGRTRALDATELLQLMQFEDNENAGIEAITLMIQLKRDMEAAIAHSKHHSHVKAA